MTIATFDTYAAAKADIARIEGQLGAIKWVLGFLAALTVAIAARLFGAFQAAAPGEYA